MVKVISLSEPAYRALLRRKKEGMSFSDVVLKSIGKDGEEKTGTAEDLLRWARGKSERFRGKRKNLVKDIDRMVYGV